MGFAMTPLVFEADIRGEYLRIPNYERIRNKHVRVVIEVDESPVQRDALPEVFTRPLRVSDYRLIGQRDDWHTRG
jgi:hypothetical protein